MPSSYISTDSLNLLYFGHCRDFDWYCVTLVVLKGLFTWPVITTVAQWSSAASDWCVLLAVGGGDTVLAVPRQRGSVQWGDRTRRAARCALHRDPRPTHAVRQVPADDRQVRERVHPQVPGHGHVGGIAWPIQHVLVISAASQRGYRGGAGYTLENSSVNVLVAIGKGMWTVKICALISGLIQKPSWLFVVFCCVHFVFIVPSVFLMPSVPWRCWLGSRKGIRPVKNWVVGCWHGYLSGARCRLAYGPDDASATHCLLLQ